MTLYCVNASIQWMLCTIPFGLSISPIVCQQRSPAPELQVPEPPASLQPGGFAPYTGEGWPGGALPPGAPGVGEYLGVPGWGTGFCLNRHGSLRAEGGRREKLARLGHCKWSLVSLFWGGFPGCLSPGQLTPCDFSCTCVLLRSSVCTHEAVPGACVCVCVQIQATASTARANRSGYAWFCSAFQVSAVVQTE